MYLWILHRVCFSDLLWCGGGWKIQAGLVLLSSPKILPTLLQYKIHKGLKQIKEELYERLKITIGAILAAS